MPWPSRSLFSCPNHYHGHLPLPNSQASQVCLLLPARAEVGVMCHVGNRVRCTMHKNGGEGVPAGQSRPMQARRSHSCFWCLIYMHSSYYLQGLVTHLQQIFLQHLIVVGEAMSKMEQINFFKTKKNLQGCCQRKKLHHHDHSFNVLDGVSVRFSHATCA